MSWFPNTHKTFGISRTYRTTSADFGPTQVTTLSIRWPNISTALQHYSTTVLQHYTTSTRKQSTCHHTHIHLTHLTFLHSLTHSLTHSTHHTSLPHHLTLANYAPSLTHSPLFTKSPTKTTWSAAGLNLHFSSNAINSSRHPCTAVWSESEGVRVWVSERKPEDINTNTI